MEAKRAGFGCVRTVDRTPLRLRTSEPVFGVGRRHVIKLYLKGEEPKKLEVKSILSLMDEQLQDSKKSLTMAILDVRRAKLISDLPPDPGLVALMMGEAAAIATIWPRL